jgi:hypothetical protein
MAGLCLAGHSDASAQTAATIDTPWIATANILAQPSTRNLIISHDFPIYGENGNVTSTQHIGSGALFDISGGYAFTERLAGAIGISVFGNSATSVGTATVPNPLFFNQSRVVTFTQDDLSHREVGIHLQVRYTYPVRDKIDVVLVGGPSIFHVKQQLVSTVNVPTGTQDATAIVSSESKNAFGGNIGVEGNYYFTPMWGAGVLIRYAGAKSDLPSVSGLKIGGFQAGVGVRARF